MMMILSRICLLIVCCVAICNAASDVQSIESSDETMVIDLIYGCFEDRGEGLAQCDLYQNQIDCLKPFSANQFVKELLEGLDSTVSIYGCQKKDESSPNANDVEASDAEKDVAENELESESESAVHHRERRMFKSPCQNYKHPRLDNACANWMFNNYHLLNPGWEKCSTFDYNYTKPCGWYWAKCKRAHRNHHCCVSVHCHGGLG